jgi:endonuclease YncB( thermonuclease family)
MRILSYGAILAAMCCPLDAYGAGAEHFIPDCAGAVEIPHARVLRVDQDGTLVSSKGQALRLEGIRLPSMHDKAVYDRSQAALRALALSGTVSFTAVTPVRDRYGRLRVQGFGQAWLQVALLERGLARVQVSPDRQECAPDLYEAEARARDRRLGIWAMPNYRVRTPELLAGAVGTFQVVEGPVGNIGRADGRTFRDLGDKPGGRRGFAVVIGPQDRHAFRDFDFEDLPGRRIRVRGIVQDYRGRPEMVLSNPMQIEVLD